MQGEGGEICAVLKKKKLPDIITLRATLAAATVWIRYLFLNNNVL